MKLLNAAVRPVAKKIIMLVLALALTLPGLSAFAEPVELENNPAPELGVEAALERARTFNSDRLSLSAEALAEKYGFDLTETRTNLENGEMSGAPVEVNEGDTWETVMGRLFMKYEKTNEYGVGIGYYCPETGEEQYINGDQYMISASMFKVPTNMIIADMVSKGEITMDENIAGYPYSYQQYMSIVYSDNSRWQNLRDYLGGYEALKEKQIPYLGNDPNEDFGWNYHVDNYYNARQFIHMLRMMYEEPDRFPGIIECMLEANPLGFFRSYETRYPVAQKFGYAPYTAEESLDGASHYYYTCCGIVYADSPFMIVMFTDNVYNCEGLLAEYATCMTDYTNMTVAAEKRKAEEAAAAEEQRRLEAEQELQKRLEADVAEAAVEATPKPVLVSTVEETKLGNFTAMDCLIMGWAALTAIICCVFIFRRNMAGRINGFWAVLGVIFAALAVVACVVGLRMGNIYAAPAGDPTEPVNNFFYNIAAGDYQKAYTYLSDYETLGLENEPDTEESRLICNALRESYDYSLRGDCVRDRLSAVQRVSFQYLSLDSVKSDAAGRIPSLLKEIVESRTNSQVYDGNGEYLQSVTDEVYRKALTEALTNSTKYRTSIEVSVDVTYDDGVWLMSLPKELIPAMTGNPE